jgi:predicted metal-binding membrane protein
LPAWERAVLIAALAMLTLAAATYTVLGAGMEMSAIERTLRVGLPAVVPLPEPPINERVPWTLGYSGQIFRMWWVMMAAMMIPAAGPAVLAYAARERAQGIWDSRLVPALVFLAGHLTVWGLFSFAMMLLQWAMEIMRMVSHDGMFVTHNVLGGAILTAAGIFQFSIVKHRWLMQSRSPERRLERTWTPGLAGAFRMGQVQGLYCLGCCWFLMAMLFFGGIMNLYCIVGIAALVAVEHWWKRGDSIGLGVGAVLILWGVLFLASAVGLA